MAIIIGVGGWFVYDVFEATEDELEKARARITQLEERVQITDEAVTETGASASEQINLWESEIRRLEQQRKIIKLRSKDEPKRYLRSRPVFGD